MQLNLTLDPEQCIYHQALNLFKGYIHQLNHFPGNECLQNKLYYPLDSYL